MDCSVIQRSCTAQLVLQVIARSPVTARENLEAPQAARQGLRMALGPSRSAWREVVRAALVQCAESGNALLAVLNRRGIQRVLVQTPILLAES